MDTKKRRAPWSAWWRSRNFLLPPMYGGHKHRWVYVDAGAVGCELCGVVHVCELGPQNVVACELQYTDEGSCVCALTALELRCSMFMDEQLDVETYNRNRGIMYASGSTGAERNTRHFQENMQVQRGRRCTHLPGMRSRAWHAFVCLACVRVPGVRSCVGHAGP